jgi:translocation and assembly module TamB
MSGRDMRLRFPEGMRSLVDADLTLQGTAENAVLSGTVNVKDAVYREAFTTSGSLFDFSQEASLAPAATPSETLPVRLDVRVNAPSTLQIDNRTLRLVANADLQVRGTIDKPVLLGRAEIDRGEALFEGSATSSRAERWTSTIPPGSSRSSTSKRRRASECLRKRIR